jgi:predicted metal-dependent enzyme (double-stranded beta helix superfamily)
MPKANLSIVAQKLYECIAGKQFVLDTPDFPEFSQSIEHSIRTPGKWCHERLKQKSTEFDKNKPDEKETYLRITLGENNGESPGIPYVMEIWPSGHYSPIHTHAGASAVIRVLHGSINVSLFPFLSGDVLEPFAKADFKQDDITWISPSLNQIHQLKNTGTKTCITIQCYMYKQGNTSHYDYFDYLDGSGTTQQYEPDSDMDFLEFKARMKQEWLELKATKRFWFC